MPWPVSHRVRGMGCIVRVGSVRAVFGGFSGECLSGKQAEQTAEKDDRDNQANAHK